MSTDDTLTTALREALATPAEVDVDAMTDRILDRAGARRRGRLAAVVGCVAALGLAGAVVLGAGRAHEDSRIANTATPTPAPTVSLPQPARVIVSPLIKARDALAGMDLSGITSSGQLPGLTGLAPGGDGQPTCLTLVVDEPTPYTSFCQVAGWQAGPIDRGGAPVWPETGREIAALPPAQARDALIADLDAAIARAGTQVVASYVAEDRSITSLSAAFPDEVAAAQEQARAQVDPNDTAEVLLAPLRAARAEIEAAENVFDLPYLAADPTCLALDEWTYCPLGGTSAGDTLNVDWSERRTAIMALGQEAAKKMLLDDLAFTERTAGYWISESAVYRGPATQARIEAAFPREFDYEAGKIFPAEGDAGTAADHESVRDAGWVDVEPPGTANAWRIPEAWPESNALAVDPAPATRTIGTAQSWLPGGTCGAPGGAPVPSAITTWAWGPPSGVLAQPQSGTVTIAVSAWADPAAAAQAIIDGSGTCAYAKPSTQTFSERVTLALDGRTTATLTVNGSYLVVALVRDADAPVVLSGYLASQTAENLGRLDPAHATRTVPSNPY